MSQSQNRSQQAPLQNPGCSGGFPSVPVAVVFSTVEERYGGRPPFDLLFSQAIRLAFIPAAAHSEACAMGQGMQKNLQVPPVPAMPYAGSLLVLSQREIGAVLAGRWTE